MTRRKPFSTYGDRDAFGTPKNRAKCWGKRQRCPKTDRRSQKKELRSMTGGYDGI
tara:strand:+ start:64 stop:228 length:165 start_codon:yes stop_codon:yes gene_type:complete